jgi:hypothetical protein
MHTKHNGSTWGEKLVQAYLGIRADVLLDTALTQALHPYGTTPGVPVHCFATLIRHAAWQTCPHVHMSTPPLPSQPRVKVNADYNTGGRGLTL